MRYWVSDFDGKFILATSDKEFARRMCAAVNACEGLKTENLENAGRLRDGLETVQRRIEELKAQNARLLEALRIIQSYDEGNGCCPYGCDCPTIARTAIAKAKTQSPTNATT